MVAAGVSTASTTIIKANDAKGLVVTINKCTGQAIRFAGCLVSVVPGSDASLVLSLQFVIRIIFVIR